MWVLIINLIITPFLIPFFFTGDPVGTRYATQTVRFDSRYQVSGIVSGSGNQALAVLNGDLLVHVDFDSKETKAVAALPDGSEYAQQNGNLVYSVAPTSGVISAVEVTTGSTVWTTTKSLGIRGVIIHDGPIYVGDPVGKKMISLDNGTGLDEVDVPMDCRPWDLTVAAGSVYVSCLDTSMALELSPDSLAETARFPIPIGSTSIFSCAASTCVLSRWEHRIVPVGRTRCCWHLPEGGQSIGRVKRRRVGRGGV